MIRNRTVDTNIINLDGPDGNANTLLGLASRLCSDVGYASDEKETILNKMMAGDYINLLTIFEEYFGKHVSPTRAHSKECIFDFDDRLEK